jgi:uncharacterized membrane protein
MKKNILSVFAWLLVLFFSWQMYNLSIVYLVPPFRTDIDFLLTKQEVIGINWWRCAFYVHISTSLFTILSGLTQFSTKIYTKFPIIHRTVGKIYVFTILCLSAPSGFVLACYANGGLPTQIAFVLLSTLWFGFTLRAYTTARNGDFLAHRKFMWRSYALTWSAITLRLLQFVFGTFALFDYENAYLIAAWGGWLLNLLLVEVYLQFSRSKVR